MDDRAATKADLLEVEHRLEMKVSEVKADIRETRSELKADIELAKRDMTIKLGGLPPHP